MTALIGLSAMAAVVLLIVIWPLIKGSRAPISRDLYDEAVRQDQLEELTRDVSRGVISESDAAAAAREIERHLAESGDAQETTSLTATRTGLAVGLVTICLACTFLIYRTTGAPGLPDQPIVAREAMQLGVPVAELENILEITRKLEEQLATMPDNAEGWALLARTYRQMNRGDQAIRAFRRAADLNRADTQLLADYGEVAVAMAGGRVSEEAFAAFAASLAAAPRNPRARFYLGLARAQAGQPEAALAIWKDLFEESEENAPWMPMLTAQMSAVSEGSGIAMDSVEARAPELPEAGIPQEAAAQDEMIRTMVSRLAARLVDEPDNFEGWLQLGRSYAVLEDFDGAWDAFESAADLDPNNAQAIWELAAGLFPADSEIRTRALANASAGANGDSPD